MNLQQLRDYVRRQLDVDEEELPNETLDPYLSEAYDRTLALYDEWPFLEHRWEVSKAEGATTIVIPDDCDGILALREKDSGRRLVQIDAALAEDRFYPATVVSTVPPFFSIFAGEIILWPATDTTETVYTIRGFRKPAGMPSDTGTEIDADERLHIILAHYAIALAYAQQEDEVLEDVYMKRWAQGFEAATRAITRKRHHQPLVLNAGLAPVPRMYPGVIWNI